MRSDRGIPSGAGQVLAILVRYVLTLAVLVALCQAKINDVDAVARGFRPANQKVVWLYVTMNDSFLMNLLNSLDQLDCDH